MPDAPRKTLAEAIPELRRPFTANAIRWKVQNVFKDNKGAILVPYIDARLVIERLNHVLPDLWHAKYEPVDGKPNLMWCYLTVGTSQDMAFGTEVTRCDVGEGQGVTDGMRYKAAVSDALKRAAVHFGVGVSVYALPEVKWLTDQAGPNLELFRNAKGNTSLRISPTGFASLRDAYGKWLEKQTTFGDPLDHGDVEGQAIDDSEVEGEEFVPALPPALDDEQAKALLARADVLYESQIDHKLLPPQRYRAWRDGAAHSHEELERLVAHLEERAGAGETA